MSEGEDAGLDLETMMEQMRVLTEYANEHLAEPQRGLTYGSYWARFYDIRDRLVIFGYVEPLDTMIETERELGARDDEAEYIRADTQRRHEDGYMYGMCYSTVTPEGELGFTHRADIWPIDQAMFEQYREVAWQVDDDRLAWETKIALAQAYTEYATHTNTVLAEKPDDGRL